MEFFLNGMARTVTPAPGESLLDSLRNRCGVTSVKDGCQPQGQCGCCLALVDGQPKVSCLVDANKVGGKQVLTLEGIPAEERETIARCFVAAAGLQCGFCIPGIAMRAKHLIGKNPNPSREEIAKALDVHLCRCTGYVKIVDAVELMAKAARGEGEPAMVTDGGVGASLSRYKGIELTLGTRPYVADMTREGMLHGALTLSAHARARVKSIDTSEALAMPGGAITASIPAAVRAGIKLFGDSSPARGARPATP